MSPNYQPATVNGAGFGGKKHNMTAAQLMEARTKGPYDYQQYTIWLHNTIVNNIREALERQKERSEKADHETITLEGILDLPELQFVR